MVSEKNHQIPKIIMRATTQTSAAMRQEWAGATVVTDLLEMASALPEQRPRQDSNLRSRLRRAALYPLSYGGQRAGATKNLSSV